MNNKILKSLLAATLVVGSVQAHTNKTFLMPRPVGVNLPMETMGFRELINRKVDDKFGGNFQVAGFYRGGAGKAKLGKYFGIKEHNNVTFETSNAALVKDYNIGYLIHDVTSAGATSNNLGTITFNPKHNEYGVRLDYFQDLEKILKGLYLKANLPIVHVENDMKLNVSLASPSASVVTSANIVNYFKGSYAPAVTSLVGQVALTNALIDGKRSKTGVADVDLVLGYKFFNKEKYNASINIGLTIPTGNQAEGKYAFEPIYGNNKHFGFGGGLDGMIRVWGDTDHNFNINAAVNYRYLFQASEKRMLGVKDTSGVAWDWMPYTLVGAQDSMTATKIAAAALTPAANIFTQNVDVTPNSQLDGIIGLAYNKGGFTLDLGYNLYCRAKESVKRKDSYTDSSYGIANYKEATNAASTPTQFITGAQLTTDNCKTPSQFTNSIYGGLTYAFKEWKYPLMLNAGGAYEWVSKNSAVEGWTAMIKAALAF